MTITPSVLFKPDYSRTRAAISLIIAAFTVWDFFVEVPESAFAVCVAVALTVCILLAAVFPVPCSVLLILMDPLIVAMFTNSPSWDFYGMMMAIAILAYHATDRASIGIVAACSALLLCEVTFARASAIVAREIAAIIAMYALMALLGRSLRWREDRFETKRLAESAQAKAARLEHDARIARSIHDAVSGDVSFIARAAQRHLDGDAQTSEREWAQINDAAVSALNATHRIINALDDAHEPHANDHADASYFQHLAQIVAQGGQSLHTLGFRGSSTLHVDAETPTPPRRDQELVCELVHELHSNIIRHGLEGGDYQLSVTASATGTQIIAVNDIRPHTAQVTLPGGHGLDFYRGRILRRGGRFSAGIDDGQWECYVLLPAGDARTPQPTGDAKAGGGR
ncbi:hypothetical protein [Bifidobacterium biavatii]|uniref:histidine kinase n=1 Tax=Bifidobacterium biavatii DSM 23969 TaxID=1437608 RepID=A0A086ZYL5_9BIFI|nr:hypothetical protein [Bifidobacterium biavatii]KFI51615.1 signal transduction histidine kinase [Bifidobacterium biavatii DSM 23969]